jgi:hypothetical protein
LQLASTRHGLGRRLPAPIAICLRGLDTESPDDTTVAAYTCLLELPILCTAGWQIPESVNPVIISSPRLRSLRVLNPRPGPLDGTRSVAPCSLPILIGPVGRPNIKIAAHSVRRCLSLLRRVWAIPAPQSSHPCPSRTPAAKLRRIAPSKPPCAEVGWRSLVPHVSGPLAPTSTCVPPSLADLPSCSQFDLHGGEECPSHIPSLNPPPGLASVVQAWMGAAAVASLRRSEWEVERCARVDLSQKFDDFFFSAFARTPARKPACTSCPARALDRIWPRRACSYI